MEELLSLALDDPDEARRRAEALRNDPDPEVRSYALQSLGIVLRDEGRIAEALDVLRVGLRAAEQCEDLDRARDVRATLGVALALGGRCGAALRELEKARSGATGALAAKVALRLAAVLALAGRLQDAVPLLRGVLVDLQAFDEPVWEARTHDWLAHVQLRLGHVDAAERDATAAARLLQGTDATYERTSAMALLAYIAVARGDVAHGLRRYASAVHLLVDAGMSVPFDVLEYFARAYAAAGLARTGAELLSEFGGELAPLDQANALLAQAGLLLASGDLAEARDAADRAVAMFRSQGRPWFERRGRLALAQARLEVGDRRGLARQAASVAGELDAEGADEAPVALTLAGRLAAGEERGELWRRAASYRAHPNALVRAAAWLARALEREDAGDGAGALRACRAGLDAIDEQRRLLGSSELRAQATTHGRELTEVALRTAAAEPRRLLRWAERTRATTLAQPRVTSDAATIPESLAALRDNGRQLAEARQAGEPTERLEQERLRLERAVRAESHTVSAAATERDRPVGLEEIVAGVGDGCLVEIVDVEGVLHVLVVHDGRVRRRVAGSAADAAALLDPVAMLLRRSARGRPASTDEIGRRLQAAILGDAVRLIPDGPVVIAPTTRLHGLPWSVLPALGDRPFTVVPSAGQWLRARDVRRPRSRRTVLVAGPGLASGGAEVPVLAREHPDALLLAGKQATLDAVLAGIDGADLAHLAAHGHFRADSPLFSSLDLADGPLTVHDIERIGRAPYRVVLSACDSGVLAPVGAQELLGLSAALFSLGTAGLVCSVAEVNDDATADLMVGLHAGLAQGDDAATALWRARRVRAGDPIAAGTAAAFLALGV